MESILNVSFGEGYSFVIYKRGNWYQWYKDDCYAKEIPNESKLFDSERKCFNNLYSVVVVGCLNKP